MTLQSSYTRLAKRVFWRSQKWSTLKSGYRDVATSQINGLTKRGQSDVEREEQGRLGTDESESRL